VKKVTPKVSRETVNTISAAAMIPGMTKAGGHLILA
jgi:hypothetical protein